MPLHVVQIASQSAGRAVVAVFAQEEQAEALRPVRVSELRAAEGAIARNLMGVEVAAA